MAGPLTRVPGLEQRVRVFPNRWGILFLGPHICGYLLKGGRPLPYAGEETEDLSRPRCAQMLH